jgi:hypothetical protein
MSAPTVACSLSFFNETIYVPDQGWCYFAIYHSSFFYVFGTATLCMLGVTLLNALYCCAFDKDMDHVVYSIKLTAAFLVLAMGAEVFMLVFWLTLIVTDWGCWRHVCPVVPVFSTNLPTQESMVPEPDGAAFTQTNTSAECPICLESSSSSPWITLANCGHQFHHACIVAAGKNKCPLCRGRVWKEVMA